MKIINPRSMMLLVVLGLASCGYDNSQYCAGALHNSCFYLDASTGGDAVDAPSGCTSDQSCSGSSAVCDLTDKMCVQCTATEHAACVGTTPTCGSNDTCQACTSHADCASNACLPDGSCGSDTNVAYVDPAGTDNTTCSKAMPCTDVSKALATSRPYVKFHGTTDEAVTINNQNVTFLADPSAELTYSTNGNILVVQGTSVVAIYDLEVGGASGTGAGISMSSGGTQQLSLYRVLVTNNAGGGISSLGGALTVSQSTISSNGTSTSAIGGISVSGATFNITNNFIHHNGNDIGASAGGVSLTSSGSNTFSYNTVVDNQADLGAASAGGVFCDRPGFVAAHNLIYRNTGGSSTTAQTFGSCTYDDSFVMSAASGSNTPAFVSPNVAPFDYHLTAASPNAVLNAADACSVPIDFDGDARPQGPACDLGADEYKQP